MYVERTAAAAEPRIKRTSSTIRIYPKMDSDIAIVEVKLCPPWRDLPAHPPCIAHCTKQEIETDPMHQHALRSHAGRGVLPVDLPKVSSIIQVSRIMRL